MLNRKQVKLELAKKEAEEKLRKEREEAEEMERRRRNPEKSKYLSVENESIMTRYDVIFSVLDRRTDRGREIRFNYDQPKEDDDVDGIPMEEDKPRQRSRSRERNVFLNFIW